MSAGRDFDVVIVDVGDDTEVSNLGVDQADVGLVDQGGRLESLPRLLLGHLLCRQFPQLVVDQRQKLLGGMGIAFLDGGQDAVLRTLKRDIIAVPEEHPIPELFNRFLVTHEHIALVVDAFPVAERGRALGMVGMVVAAGLTLNLTGPGRIAPQAWAVPPTLLGAAMC